MVRDIFVPVSPSGTGNTLSASTFVLFISSTLAPATIILRNSVPFTDLGMEIFRSLPKDHSFTPMTFTLTVSTIMPVNLSTLYLTLSFKDSATALIETPNLMMTYTSI